MHISVRASFCLGERQKIQLCPKAMTFTIRTKKAIIWIYKKVPISTTSFQDSRIFLNVLILKKVSTPISASAQKSCPAQTPGRLQPPSAPPAPPVMYLGFLLSNSLKSSCVWWFFHHRHQYQPIRLWRHSLPLLLVSLERVHRHDWLTKPGNFRSDWLIAGLSRQVTVLASCSKPNQTNRTVCALICYRYINHNPWSRLWILRPVMKWLASLISWQPST